MVREPVLRPLEDPTAEYRATIRDMSDAVRQRITRKLTVLTWLFGTRWGCHCSRWSSSFACGDPRDRVLREAIATWSPDRAAARPPLGQQLSN